ncbi:hypothetical protein FS837_003415 [Tulasnella sp. UAMH 9824]|nr:hypothetical protein FS837_003415 [Tulasnella sp. UAMH 9824]
MRQGTIHLIRLVLLYDQNSGVKHDMVKKLDRDMYLSLLFSHILDPHTYMEKRGDELVADVVEVLMALSLDNRLSGRAASWAATEFGPSFVSAGFFKFSQLILEKDQGAYCFAPLELAAHLLASEDNHEYMVDRQRVPLFCINMYWSLVKRYDTIDGMATMGFSSAIARFIHVVLDAVKDPRRQTTIISDLVKEADLVILLGRMWINSWGPNNGSIVEGIGKRIASTAGQDLALIQQYIKPAWLHVQKCLESRLRVKEPSQKLPSQVLDQWTANLGRHLGWVAESDAFLLRNDPCELKLVGCSWIRYAVGAQRDWSLGGHRKICGKKMASQFRDLTSLKAISS